MKKVRIVPNEGTKLRFRFMKYDDGVEASADYIDLGGAFEVEGHFDIVEVDTTKYVSVELVSGSGVSPGPWTYIDPWGDLDYGDIVQVPFGVSNRLFTGRITASDVERPNKYVTVKTVLRRARFE